MATAPSADNSQLLDQLVQLTDAVKQLAERPAQPVVVARTDADRIRQRVAFGYQVLGTLTGRVSTASGDEFDVRVVRARRRPGIVEFDGLPPGADWVELRAGNRAEVLRIHRDDRDDDRADAPSTSGAGRKSAGRGKGDGPDGEHDRRRPHQSDQGFVRPDFPDSAAIGSIVFLRHQRGPLIAFGPRLGPVTPDPRTAG